jgi:hypothetical protein
MGKGGVMARRKTHKFSLRTKGLTDEQAAQVAYLVSCAGWALTSEGDTELATNVPVAVLRSQFPNSNWERCTAADRVALVQ